MFGTFTLVRFVSMATLWCRFVGYRFRILRNSLFLLISGFVLWSRRFVVCHSVAPFSSLRFSSAIDYGRTWWSPFLCANRFLRCALLEIRSFSESFAPYSVYFCGITTAGEIELYLSLPKRRKWVLWRASIVGSRHGRWARTKMVKTFSAMRENRCVNGASVKNICHLTRRITNEKKINDK